jgi:hypothetical protein
MGGGGQPLTCKSAINLYTNLEKYFDSNKDVFNERLDEYPKICVMGAGYCEEWISILKYISDFKLTSPFLSIKCLEYQNSYLEVAVKIFDSIKSKPSYQNDVSFLLEECDVFKAGPDVLGTNILK